MPRSVRAGFPCLFALALAGTGFAEVARGAAPGGASAARQTVILLVIDTLRADHLGIHGYGRDTTPTLDRLARSGLHLPHVVVQAPQTAPSMASILTSTLPSQHGIQYNARTNSFTDRRNETSAPVLPESAVTLAEWLGRHGFHTAAVVANPWLREDSGFAQGFARYTQLGCVHAAQEGFSCDGARINALAESILTERAGEPVFLYLHYMDVHSPYAHGGRLPQRWREAPGRDVFRENGPAPGVSAANLRYTMALYDEGIAYTDGLVDRLLRFLEGRGLLQETTLLVTTDHGEEFLEHGGLGHGTSLHHELVQGFAVLWSPRRVAAERIDDRVAAIDLLPTLLGVLGLESPSRIAGRDARALAASGRPRDVFAELADQKALLRGEWKLVLHLDPPLSEAARIDVAGRTLETVGANAAPAMRAMRATVDELVRRGSRGEISRLDDETIEALRALGYLN